MYILEVEDEESHYHDLFNQFSKQKEPGIYLFSKIERAVELVTFVLLSRLKNKYNETSGQEFNEVFYEIHHKVIDFLKGTNKINIQFFEKFRITEEEKKLKEKVRIKKEIERSNCNVYNGNLIKIYSVSAGVLIEIDGFKEMLFLKEDYEGIFTCLFETMPKQIEIIDPENQLENELIIGILENFKNNVKIK